MVITLGPTAHATLVYIKKQPQFIMGVLVQVENGFFAFGWGWGVMGHGFQCLHS